MKTINNVWNTVRKYSLRLVLSGGFLLLACCLFTFSQQDNVRECVVRHVIAGQQTDARNPFRSTAVFVSVDSHDPDNDLIKRFQQNNPAVYRMSQGIRKVPMDVYTEYWMNPTTGLKGTLVSIGKIVWVGPLMARVEVSYPTSGFVYTVVKTFSGWRVVSQQLSWIH